MFAKPSHGLLITVFAGASLAQLRFAARDSMHAAAAAAMSRKTHAVPPAAAAADVTQLSVNLGMLSLNATERVAVDGHRVLQVTVDTNGAGERVAVPEHSPAEEDPSVAVGDPADDDLCIPDSTLRRLSGKRHSGKADPIERIKRAWRAGLRAGFVLSGHADQGAAMPELKGLNNAVLHPPLQGCQWPGCQRCSL